MTEAQTLTLADFLLARISDDEQTARAAATDAWAGSWWHDHMDERAYNAIQADAIARATRALDECVAKRRIVTELHWTENGTLNPDHAGDCFTCQDTAPCLTLRLLALPYSDHQDFRQEWRP